MSRARTPSLLLVLAPGLILALIGVRAVVAEVDAGRERSRADAAAAGARIARAADVLIAEHLAALPAAGASIDSAEIDLVLQPLYPRWIVHEDGRATTLRELVGPGPALRDPDQVATARLGVERAERLAREQPEIAGAFAAATAQALDDAWSVGALYVCAARLELADGRPSSAFDAALRALDVSADVRDSGLGAHFAQALRFAAQSRSPDDEPLLLVTAYETLATDPYGVDERLRGDTLDTVEARLGGDLPPTAHRLRALWDILRAEARGNAPEAAAEFASDGLHIRVQRRVLHAPSQIPLRIGGEIPAASVRERIAAEVDALVGETDVRAVRVLAPDGTPALSAGDWSSDAGTVVVATPLARDLAGWTVRTLPATPTGIPTLAWVLAVAGAATTIALVAGALALRRAAERQAQLAEDRRSFLDHVAHEVRTPSAALLALSEELASGTVSAERQPEYFAHLHTESQRLARLVEETLDLARLESGRLAVQREEIDLRDVVRRAAEDARGGSKSQPDAAGVDVRVPADPVVRSADGRALGRAIRNLIENALRHSGTQRPVEIELDEAARIIVRDHGRGIAPAHQQRLFERFYRVPSETHESKGVGLGLALCREVVAAHGGSVRVESGSGAGATFVVELPPLTTADPTRADRTENA